MGGTFSEKMTFYLLAPPKQMSFLTIFNENIFLKIQGTRLSAIVAPNKGLEQALVEPMVQLRDTNLLRLNIISRFF